MAGNEESEEDDYMSDAFLASCEDKRPGLVTGEAARKLKQEKKVKVLNVRHQQKPRQQLEAEKRDEGLNNALGADNKGFALLAKMGFKPGMVLGKKGTGRAEPVPIDFRAGRSGLGRDSEMKRKQNEVNSMRLAMAAKRQKVHQRMQVDYRSHMSQKNAEKSVERDLRKSQIACEQLDTAQGVTEPLEKFFWLERVVVKPEDDEEDGNAKEEEEDEEEEEEQSVQFSALEQLQVLTLHLRRTHFYCLWCGITYNGKDDLEQNCPGMTREAHDD